MKSLWVVFPFSIVLLLFTPVGYGSDKEDRLLIAYLYNFGKFIDWPVAKLSEEDDVDICLYGKNGALVEAANGLEKRKLKRRDIKVRILERGMQFDICHIMYISESERLYLAPLLQEAFRNNIVTISNIEGFLESGGVIELTNIDNKLRFSINLKTAQANDLKVSSQLIRLALSIIK